MMLCGTIPIKHIYIRHQSCQLYEGPGTLEARRNRLRTKTDLNVTFPFLGSSGLGLAVSCQVTGWLAGWLFAYWLCNMVERFHDSCTPISHRYILSSLDQLLISIQTTSWPGTPTRGITHRLRYGTHLDIPAFPTTWSDPNP